METAAKSAQSLTDFLLAIKKGPRVLRPGEEKALKEDIAFMEMSVSILAGGDKDKINVLWGKVQALSRFFGGDYLRGEEEEDQFKILKENFWKACLEKAGRMRKE